MSEMSPYHWHYTSNPEQVFHNVGNYSGPPTKNRFIAIVMLTTGFDSKSRRYYRESFNKEWIRLESDSDYKKLNSIIGESNVHRRSQS